MNKFLLLICIALHISQPSSAQSHTSNGGEIKCDISKGYNINCRLKDFFDWGVYYPSIDFDGHHFRGVDKKSGWKKTAFYTAKQHPIIYFADAMHTDPEVSGREPHAFILHKDAVFNQPFGWSLSVIDTPELDYFYAFASHLGFGGKGPEDKSKVDCSLHQKFVLPDDYFYYYSEFCGVPIVAVNKLYEIGTINQKFAHKLSQKFLKLNWIWIQEEHASLEGPFNRTHDGGSTTISQKGNINVATRQDGNVRIGVYPFDATIWAHKVGVLFHENLASITEDEQGDTDSGRAEHANALLFTEDDTGNSIREAARLMRFADDDKDYLK